MILSLTRTAFLTMPFKRIDKRAVLLSIVVYCIIQVRISCQTITKILRLEGRGPANIFLLISK
jgi:hypothetical protein